mmetsp:Transcript_15493/g.42760  ORF Transcript_15493/g.42760 Transcript_15493/m.42760 type:complete len:214 (+) Transcript_15493:545-1186(+)
MPSTASRKDVFVWKHTKSASMLFTSKRKQCFQSCMLSAVSELLGYLWLNKCFQRMPSSPRLAKKRPHPATRAASSGVKADMIWMSNLKGTRPRAVPCGLATGATSEHTFSHSIDEAAVDATSSATSLSKVFSSPTSDAEPCWVLLLALFCARRAFRCFASVSSAEPETRMPQSREQGPWFAELRTPTCCLSCFSCSCCSCCFCCFFSVRRLCT